MENQKFKGIIYKATNLINRKCYVGKTSSNFEKYKNDHIRNALNERDIKQGYRKTFYDAIRKYGKDNFKWELLKENINDLLLLNIMETFMIMVHHSHWTENGYNLTWGGDGGDLFTNHPNKELIREKNRRSGIGRVMSDESRRKSRESQIGRKQPQTSGDNNPAKRLEVRQKISDSKSGEKHHMYGKHHTKEHNERVSKKLKGRIPWNKGLKAEK